MHYLPLSINICTFHFFVRVGRNSVQEIWEKYSGSFASFVKISAEMSHKIVWYFECKERLGEVCVLRHGLRHLRYVVLIFFCPMFGKAHVNFDAKNWYCWDRREDRTGNLFWAVKFSSSLNLALKCPNVKLFRIWSPSEATSTRCEQTRDGQCM